MGHIVSDDLIIVNTQGIRTVEYGESTKSTYRQTKPYFISITYKGGHSLFYYDSLEEVKSIYNKIRVAMKAI